MLIMNDKDMLSELISYKERLQVALKVARICIFEVDLTRQLYTYFENSEEIFGVRGEDILKDVQKFSDLSPEEYQKAASNYFSHPDDSEMISYAFESILAGKPITYNARMKVANTDYIWCKLDIIPISNRGIPVKMIGVITDINDLISKNEDLRKKANIDEFTGLYKKVVAEELIKDALKKYPRQRHALLLVDIDNFKKINDTYGHAMGDNVLVSFSNKIKKIFRHTDIIGRFGGDEFIIFIRDIFSVDFLCSKLNQLLEDDKDSVFFTKSIGVAIYPDKASNYKDLFEMADKAMYQSKVYKNMYTIYDC